MANFYSDNYDIQFLLKHMDIGRLAELNEEGFKFAKDFDYAPATPQEAVDNYAMVLNAMGELCGDFIAPRAEAVDRTGNILNEDGSVTRPQGVVESMEKLSQAEVMGITLPHRFGGLNFPNTIYSMTIEIVSRADASLMNLFGLQGIAETINFFASEEIKQEYLHDFADGKVTGAMVLTEPDAGSDLQACKLRAYQDDKENWYLHGVKRFITNGCGEVLLVLSRSEPDRKGGLGLSLFVCEPGPKVHIRRLEDKLGIHGSPTCEIFFDHTPCRLIGERKRGLAPYVASLMNGARIGIAGQSLGISEAAYQVARDYAASRKQFGVAIEKLPAVRDMLINMKIDIEASRALLYETGRVVDMELGLTKLMDNPPEDKAEAKALKAETRKYKRLASLLTPMSKYYCSEVCNAVTYDGIQVLGGSGFMRDYASERFARDARITTIYEGTSQLQVVAAVRGVCNGTAEKYLADLAARAYDPALENELKLLSQGTAKMLEAMAYIKEINEKYMDLYGRQLVDIAIDLIIGYLFCDQASTQVDMQVPVSGDTGHADGKTVSMKSRKAKVAKRFITRNAAKIKALTEEICAGDQSTFSEYECLVGPIVPQ
ncbi:MAG: acyl-CoA dehydrogenase family protein [Phycisphaerae bacterium]|nr:acyl-CoA dehydrogenase family protein [Phycisphaerae bacterium]